MLSLACIPSRNEPFPSVATHAPDAVVGHFIRLDDNPAVYGFTVTSSLRKTVKPGNYQLMIEGPYGPPANTSMPCPGWTTIALPHLPDGASTDQRQWVLLIRKAESDTLYLTTDERYAAEWATTWLVQRHPYRHELARVNARQFIRWFHRRPNSADQTAWLNAAPVWQTLKENNQ